MCADIQQENERKRFRCVGVKVLICRIDFEFNGTVGKFRAVCQVTASSIGIQIALVFARDFIGDSAQIASKLTASVTELDERIDVTTASSATERPERAKVDQRDGFFFGMQASKRTYKCAEW